jgi:6,7-dimethyl-8-ribityllumazine synthase
VHETVEVPGALEIPTAIRLAALGRLRRLRRARLRDPRRDDALRHGLQRQLARPDPARARRPRIGNGILTVENRAQAEVRADPAGMDKGGGAAEAACT